MAHKDKFQKAKIRKFIKVVILIVLIFFVAFFMVLISSDCKGEEHRGDNPQLRFVPWDHNASSYKIIGLQYYK